MSSFREGLLKHAYFSLKKESNASPTTFSNENSGAVLSTRNSVVFSVLLNLYVFNSSQSDSLSLQKNPPIARRI
mgnify:CR=1 FL=1